MEDEYVGEVIGNYRVLSLCEEIAPDGHKLYDAQCTKCGTIVRHERIAEFKRNNLGKECFHRQPKVIWTSERLRKIMADMRRRCYCSSSISYPHYGAKGIKICSEWLNNEQTFNDWAVSHGYNENLTIDRINPKLDYSPANYRWIPQLDNSKWKSTTNRICVNGITDSGRGWANRLGTSVNYVNRFLRKNGYAATVKMIQSEIA